MVRRSPALGKLQQLKPDPGQATVFDAQPASRGVGDVYFPALYEGATVVNPHDPAFPTLGIDNPNQRPERQGLVRRSRAIHVVGFSIGGQPPMELWTIPACQAMPDPKGLDGMAGMRYQGGFQAWRDQEHQ